MFTGGCVVSFGSSTESQSGQHYLPHMTASTQEQLEKAVCEYQAKRSVRVLNVEKDNNVLPFS